MLIYLLQKNSCLFYSFMLYFLLLECYIHSFNNILGGIILDKLVITGKTPLKGDVIISGAKNAAVAILPAALLIDGICTIENLPNISDVRIFCDILKELGAKITWNSENEITIDTRNVCGNSAPLEMTSKFRASYYLIGALLSRCGEAMVGMPGGCKLGA